MSDINTVDFSQLSNDALTRYLDDVTKSMAKVIQVEAEQRVLQSQLRAQWAEINEQYTIIERKRQDNGEYLDQLDDNFQSLRETAKAGYLELARRREKS